MKKNTEWLEESGWLRILKEISKYQFGVDIIPEEELEAVISKTKKLKELYYRGRRYIGLQAKTTSIMLYLEAGKRLFELTDRRRVYISDPKYLISDVFSAHVVDADDGIRPNDEVVVVYGDEVIGVGKARISGRSMKEFSRGVAVKIRESAF